MSCAASTHEGVPCKRAGIMDWKGHLLCTRHHGIALKGHLILTHHPLPKVPTR